MSFSMPLKGSGMALCSAAELEEPELRTEHSSPGDKQDLEAGWQRQNVAEADPEVEE